MAANPDSSSWSRTLRPPGHPLRPRPRARHGDAVSSAAPTSRSTTSTSPPTKPEPKELGAPRQLRHRRRAGRQGARLRRLRRPADLVGHREPASRSARVEAHAKWIRDVAASPRRQDRRQRRRRHGLPALGCRDRQAAPRTARPQEKTPHHFPSMLYACAFSPDGKHAGDRRQGRPRRRLGRGDRQAGRRRSRPRSCTPGTRCSAATRSAASARWPSRRTASCWPSAASARSATSTTWKARPASRCSTGKSGKRTHEFPGDKFKGLVEPPGVPPGRRLAARRPAAPATAS